MMNRCWVCGQPANSAEHRIKKSDLVNLYGSGPYKGKDTLLLIRGEHKIPIQGPNSKHVKYGKDLCAKCNNEFSQPFDKAYEKFISYVFQNESSILKRRFIDFKDIYGDDFVASQRNLYKYFAKSLGCRLAHDGYPIPRDIPSLLCKKRFWTRLRITFSVNDDKLLLPESLQKFPGKGELCTLVPLIETPSIWKIFLERIKVRTQPLTYLWNEYVGWLHVWYWYNTRLDGRLGSTWIANSQFIYLGSYEPLSDEDRKELLEKLGC